MTTSTKQKALPFWQQSNGNWVAETIVVLASIVALSLIVIGIHLIATSDPLHATCTNWNGSSFSDC